MMTALSHGDLAMWVQIGHDYLNLDNVVAVHFRDDEVGTLTATVESTSGATRRYVGSDGERLRNLLKGMGSHAVEEA
jgi:hypothetical protein